MEKNFKDNRGPKDAQEVPLVFANFLIHGEQYLVHNLLVHIPPCVLVVVGKFISQGNGQSMQQSKPHFGKKGLVHAHLLMTSSQVIANVFQDFHVRSEQLKHRVK